MNAPPGERYRADGPLPEGRLAIEASAGTGKTFALADLALRFVAERDVPPSELLIVTFTRAATNELRSRIRDRLVQAADQLEGGVPPAAEAVVLRYLAGLADPGMVDRLREAVSEFDTATITTIHGFANQIRSALGEEMGVDPDARLVDDDDGSEAETCADVLAAAATEHEAALLPSLDALRRATGVRLGRPDLLLAPSATTPRASPEHVLLAELVGRAVDQRIERRRRDGHRSFDDLLTELADALEASSASAAVASLSGRYSVVLIDEFQDTDPEQWRIFRALFAGAEARTALVLVGDPKQAIYGFRGGDVRTYLAAVGDPAVERRSLTVNWRSDGVLLHAVGNLFRGLTFGDRSVGFVPVEAAGPHRRRRIVAGDGRPLPPLVLRVANGAGIERQRNGHEVRTGSAEEAVVSDAVATVRRLLDDALVPDGPDGVTRRVRPKDIAVLLNTNAQCSSFQRALITAGVPAVVTRGGSVLRAPAASQMRWLLHGLARPSDPRCARMYALSWFGGWSARQVATAPDADLAALQEQLLGWAELLALRPVTDVLARIWAERAVVARVLGGVDGDRNMTDLDHVAELLCRAAPSGRATVAGLLAVLDSEPDADDEDDTETAPDVAARRIESDAEAVQLMTVWTAKGLEFPVVLVPMLWRWTGSKDRVEYFDGETGRRTLDVAGGKGWPTAAAAGQRKAMAAEEMAGERLRLLYVALTRARHQTVVWWSNGQASRKTALARALFSPDREAPGAEDAPAASVVIPSDDDIVGFLEDRLADGSGLVAVGSFGRGPASGGLWVDGDPQHSVGLDTASFGARPDRSAHRWSFSAITSRVEMPAGGPDDATDRDGGAADEGDHADDDAAGDRRETGLADAAASGQPAGGHADEAACGPLTVLPAGTAVGTLVHSVLERVDFSAPDLDAQLTTGVDRALARWPVDLGTSELPGGPAEGRRLLVQGLRRAIDTPLGPLCDERRLSDVGSGDRLDELAFDMRLGSPGGQANLSDVGTLVASRLEESHPFRPWAERLASGPGVLLGGHLTGSVDLVLRVAGSDGVPRFVVADYKTNKLSPRERPPRPDDYGQVRMAEAMVEHDYPLQALLYAVALHRYLRWRLPGYDPGVHLGGAVYLFLRGMNGSGDAGEPDRPGVLSWAMPPELVTGASDLLAGRPAMRALR